jgi:soluble lytic murein transglycosylase
VFKRHLKRAVVALLLLGLLGWWWRHRHPENRYDGEILAAARRYGMDPALVKAVVWRESRFDADARGTRGELGLMQLRDLAAQEWADAEQVAGFAHPDVLDPAKNTLAGTWYLRRLLRRYTNVDDPIPFALADYNAGRGNVLKWMKGAGATNSAAFLEQMTFPSTRNYVATVMARREYYRPAFPAPGSASP